MKKLNLNQTQISLDLHEESLIVISNSDFFQIPSKPKLAVFDLDHTLIKPKAYWSFPMNANDWVLTFSNVLQKLEELAQKKFLLFIVSNQLGISAFQRNNQMIVERVQNFIESTGLKMMALLATKED